MLHAEDVSVAHIAEDVGTPFYLYSAASLRARYHAFAEAFAAERPLICFAVKANSNLAVLRLLARLGAGADVVSEGELRRALAAGIPPQRIIFSGVGKTRGELEAALAAGIRQINVESIPELRRLSAVADGARRTAPVAIRVNPDVDALTHAKISTGKKENKFGIDIDDAVEAYGLAAALPGIEPVGVAVHIGSQLLDLAPFRRAFGRVAELVLELRGAGFAVTPARSRRRPRHPLPRRDPARADRLCRLWCARFSERSRSIWRSNPAACCAALPDCWSRAWFTSRTGRQSGSSSSTRR